MRDSIIIAALAVAALGGCSPGGSDAAEAEKLMQTSREWSKAAGSNDNDKVLSYFADDAVIFSDSQPPVRGKEAIRKYLAETSNIPGFKIEWEPLEARVAGEMGYLVERTQVTMTGPQGLPATQQLQAVTIWRKQSDGSWKNVVDISTAAPPARPQAASQSI